jgi:hypothetical protein
MTRCSRCNAELSAWEVRKAEELGVRPFAALASPQAVDANLSFF